MSSSDEDDDCYGNVAKKLQTLKNSYRPIRPINHVEEKMIIEDGSELPSGHNESHVDSIIDLLEEVPSVPESPATPNKPTPKKRVTRRSGRPDNLLHSSDPVSSRRGRKRKTNSQISAPLTAGIAEGSVPPPAGDLNVVAPVRPAVDSIVAPVVPAVDSNVVGPVRPVVNPDVPATPSRGGRRGGRGGRRGRGRGRHSLSNQLQAAIMNSIIYSVGNTDDYPDAAENIPIFSKSNDVDKPKAIATIDLDSSVDDENEELSVKVCWQQIDYFKFTVRRYQKLTQIFDFFSKRESVPMDRLLFTLAGRILRQDDTPDSIQYNIAKFIDGGVLTSSMGNVTTSNAVINATTGITIKFQCQNSKRPFETNVETNQKLHIAMVKCAEHFELPFSKLRFILDGETVSPSSTPEDHSLEHGDCLDVKLVA